MSITEETRLNAYLTFDRESRQKKVFSCIEKLGPMTARECADYFGFKDLNAVKPRITELKKKGKLRDIDKKKDSVTGRPVAVYEAVE